MEYKTPHKHRLVFNLATIITPDQMYGLSGDFGSLDKNHDTDSD